jgi:hypothetical protein
VTTLDVSSPKSSDHKSVKFGRNTVLQWDYNPEENHSILRGKVVIFVDVTWNGFCFNIIFSGLCNECNSRHSPTALMNCSFVARLGSPSIPLQHLATTSSRSLCESSESSDVVEEEVDDTEEGRTGLQQERHCMTQSTFVCQTHVMRMISFTHVQGSLSRLFELLLIPRDRAMLFTLSVLLVEFASSSFLSC